MANLLEPIFVRQRHASVPMVFGENGKVLLVSPFDVPIPSDQK